MATSLSARFVVNKELQQLLADLKPPRSTKILGDVLTTIGILVQSTARKEFLSGGTGRLNVRTGRLRGSITVDKGGLPRFVDVGTRLIYGPVHEFGATIVPKVAPRLVFRVGPQAHLGIGPVRTALSVRIPARPFMAPALSRVSRRADEVAVGIVARALKL